MSSSNDNNHKTDASPTNSPVLWPRSHYSGPQPSHYVTLDFTPPADDEYNDREMPPEVEVTTTPLPVRPVREKRAVSKTHSEPPPPPRPPPPKTSSRLQLEREGEPEVDEGFGSDRSTSGLDDKTKNLATAICIFSTVLTMVLVLMFYLVGEAAFKTILLIIGFVVSLSLMLACFLRQTTIIFGQPEVTPPPSDRLSATSKPTMFMMPMSSISAAHGDAMGSETTSPEPIFLILQPSKDGNNNPPVVQFSKPALVKLGWAEKTKNTNTSGKGVTQPNSNESNNDQFVNVDLR